MNSLLPGTRFVIALLLTPMVVGVIAGNLGVLWLIVDCWLLSAVVNATVAVSDYFVHTHIGERTTGTVINYGRVAGLTTQPNHLGFVCVFTLPFLLVKLVQSESRSLRTMYLGAMTLAVLGLLASGSRGGAVGGVFVIISAPFFQQAIRRRTARVLVIGFVVTAIAIAVAPSGISFISIQRLIGAPSAQASVEQSDFKRNAARQIALAQFNSSPLYGVDFSEVREAQNVYLQLLSAGGVVALLAWLAFVCGAVRSSFLFARIPQAPLELRGIAGAVCCTLVAWLLMGIVENQLYDRYLFVPCGLFVGCLVTYRRFEARQRSGMGRQTAEIGPSPRALSPT